MTIEEKRSAILKLYSRPSWKKNVAAMNDFQVEATYDALVKSGSFDRRTTRRK